MTGFIRPPITRSKPRPAADHELGCTEPGWLVQQRILDHGPLLARCRGCTAVRYVASASAQGGAR